MSVTAMMTAGSVRGKWTVAQSEQRRAQPASMIEVRPPQPGQ